MSRFNIRKKIKKMMGFSAKPEIVYHTITYILPDGVAHEIQAEEGYSILMASQSLPSSIGTGRRAGGQCPDGRCGLCRVEIECTTGLSSQDDFERKTLEDYVAGTPHEGRARSPGEPITAKTRLACQTRIIGNGSKVRVPTVVDYEALKGDDQGT